MEKIKIDGKEYEIPEQVASHLRAQKARLDAAELAAKDGAGKVAEAQAAADKATARADAAAAEIAKEKQARMDAGAATKAEIRARVELERRAEEILGAGTKLDGLESGAIKLAVLKHLDEAFDGAGKSDAYVEARFDIALEKFLAENPALEQARAAAGTQPGAKPVPRLDDDTPLREFMKASQAEWQKPLSASLK